MTRASVAKAMWQRERRMRTRAHGTGLAGARREVVLVVVHVKSRLEVNGTVTMVKGGAESGIKGRHHRHLQPGAALSPEWSSEKGKGQVESRGTTGALGGSIKDLLVSGPVQRAAMLQCWASAFY